MSKKEDTMREIILLLNNKLDTFIEYIDKKTGTGFDIITDDDINILLPPLELMEMGFFYEDVKKVFDLINKYFGKKIFYIVTKEHLFSKHPTEHVTENMKFCFEYSVILEISKNDFNNNIKTYLNLLKSDGMSLNLYNKIVKRPYNDIRQKVVINKITIETSVGIPISFYINDQKDDSHNIKKSTRSKYWGILMQLSKQRKIKNSSTIDIYNVKKYFVSRSDGPINKFYNTETEILKIENGELISNIEILVI